MYMLCTCTCIYGYIYIYIIYMYILDLDEESITSPIVYRTVQEKTCHRGTE